MEYARGSQPKEVKVMSIKSNNPLVIALNIFKGMDKSEQRGHPDRRDWEAMTFYRRDSL